MVAGPVLDSRAVELGDTMAVETASSTLLYRVAGITSDRFAGGGSAVSLAGYQSTEHGQDGDRQPDPEDYRE